MHLGQYACGCLTVLNICTLASFLIDSSHWAAPYLRQNALLTYCSPIAITSGGSWLSAYSSQCSRLPAVILMAIDVMTGARGVRINCDTSCAYTKINTVAWSVYEVEKGVCEMGQRLTTRIPLHKSLQVCRGIETQRKPRKRVPVVRCGFLVHSFIFSTSWNIISTDLLPEVKHYIRSKFDQKSRLLRQSSRTA